MPKASLEVKEKASDIMQRDVITVRQRDTLQEALLLMTENHVTGLAVMNAKDKCIGVIAATDILGYERDHVEFSSEANADMVQYFDPDSQQWESVRATSFALERFGEVRVEEVMSSDVIYVHLTTPIKDVARKMRDQKIHRVLVLDDDFRLYGIISAFDFVRLYAEE